MRNPSIRSILSAGIAAAALWSTGAQAIDYSAGEVEWPSTFTFDHNGVRGAFDDTYSFSLTAGTAKEFSFAARQVPANKFWVDFTQASLYHGSELIESAVGMRDSIFSWVDLAPVVLGEGDYRVLLSGIGGSIPQFNGGDFTAQLDLGWAPVPTPPVPEPSTLAMLALGLSALGVLRRRARQAR